MILAATFPFSNETIGAKYSVSLTMKFPFIPSKCQSSLMIDMSSLQYEIFSDVISVEYLSLTPLFLASINAFLIGSSAMAKWGRV